MDQTNFGSTLKIENSPLCMLSTSILSDNPLNWSFYPDIDVMLFDPHSPINGSLGWVQIYLIDLKIH